MRHSPRSRRETFIDRMLVAKLGAAHVVVGYDFRFGKGRGGDPETLQRAGAAHGFGVTVVAQVAEAGEVFSSGAIRAELAQGDVKGAAQMLGWWWRVSGKVTGGAKRGTGLGFPTANIALAPGTALAHGIYAVRVHLDGARHDAAAYLGTRPTFDDGAPVLEVFLLDFDGDLYGRDIAVEFIDFIRGDRRFDGTEALQAQMAQDCERRARSWQQRRRPQSSRRRGNEAGSAGRCHAGRGRQPESRYPGQQTRGLPCRAGSRIFASRIPG